MKRKKYIAINESAFNRLFLFEDKRTDLFVLVYIYREITL